MAERRTREQIEKEVAERSAAREKAYFETQAKSKADAESKLPPLPEPDVYIYDYVWRQGVGTAGGEYKLVKSPNPTYDASTNTIVDPVTGERRPVVMSTYGSTGVSGATGTGATGTGATGTGANDTDFKIISGIMTINGQPFTGTYNGITYANGVSQGKSDGTSATGFGPGSTGYNDRKSAYDLLYAQFAQYGLESLVTPLKGLIESGISPSEFTLRLRDTDAYKKRFAANDARIKSGLRALSEAEYIGLEDQYQNVMRNYGLPASYYTKGDMGIQAGFEKFIAGDVSATELEDRIITAQNRVINAAPQVSQALREFYPDITNGDILAYALDPQNALSIIKRKVGASEIGAAAIQSGLETNLFKAELLQKYGVTGEQARQGYTNIAEFLPSATKLGDIYSKQGLGAYDQATAEQEMFGIAGAADAATKRKKLAQLEQAQFGGSSGAAGGALGRERAGQF